MILSHTLVTSEKILALEELMTQLQAQLNGLLLSTVCMEDKAAPQLELHVYAHR